MPGYILHLAEASMILEKLENTDALWRNAFLNGAVLPDAVEKRDKLFTHFWTDHLEETYIFHLPGLSEFQNIFQSTLTDTTDPDFALLLGYYAHLHLDYCFFGEFMDRMVTFCPDETAIVHKNNCTIARKEFFGDQYLYGDYTKLNGWLLKNCKIFIPDFMENLDSWAASHISRDCGWNINKVKKELLYLIENVKNPDLADSLCVFEKEGVAEIIENTANQFIDLIGG